MNEKENTSRVSSFYTMFVKSPEIELDSLNSSEAIQKVWEAFDNNNHNNNFCNDNIAWD